MVSYPVAEMEAAAMAPRYRVTLTPEEREMLTALTTKGVGERRSAFLARALLLSESEPEGPGWTNNCISSALGMSERTIERVKKRFFEDGLDVALERKPPDNSSRSIKLDGAFEARLVALAQTDPPDGRCRWTVRLLAEKAVELELVDSISAMSVQRILKKKNFDLTTGSTGKSRPRRMPPS